MKKDFHIGPGAASLILIIVIVTMSGLGILSLINARGDANLSSRSAIVIEAIGNLDVASEESLSELDAIIKKSLKEAESDQECFAMIKKYLPDRMAIEGDSVFWKESDADGRILKCAVRVLWENSEKRFEWIEHRFCTDGSMELEETWN